MVAGSVFALSARNVVRSPSEPARSASVSSNQWTESQDAKSPMLQPQAWATPKFKSCATRPSNTELSIGLIWRDAQEKALTQRTQRKSGEKTGESFRQRSFSSKFSMSSAAFLCVHPLFSRLQLRRRPAGGFAHLRHNAKIRRDADATKGISETFAKQLHLAGQKAE